jgi:hypothetical protein
MRVAPPSPHTRARAKSAHPPHPVPPSPRSRGRRRGRTLDERYGDAEYTDPDYGRGRGREPSHALRLRLMMANYRGAKTLGVLENKLLAATAMKRVG